MKFREKNRALVLKHPRMKNNLGYPVESIVNCQLFQLGHHLFPFRRGRKLAEGVFSDLSATDKSYKKE